MSTASPARAIVDLLPRYLRARRAGSAPPDIAMPDYVLLRGVACEIDELPIAYDALRRRLFNPYNIIRPILDRLPRLVELGLLAGTGDGFSLTPAGFELLTRGEHSANDYAAARMQLPPDELARLASTLQDIAGRLFHAPEPSDKAHQLRVPRLRRFDDRRMPPLELEYAVYALWMARDDAHNAAWRAAGFRGPTLDLLSRVWSGDANTVAELAALTRDSLRPEDVEALLDELARDGCVTVSYPDVSITGRGRDVRDAIEHETDRVYFAPWPDVDAAWIHGRLAALLDAMTLDTPGYPG